MTYNSSPASISFRLAIPPVTAIARPFGRGEADLAVVWDGTGLVFL